MATDQAIRHQNKHHPARLRMNNGSWADTCRPFSILVYLDGYVWTELLRLDVLQEQKLGLKGQTSWCAAFVRTATEGMRRTRAAGHVLVGWHVMYQAPKLGMMVCEQGLRVIPQLKLGKREGRLCPSILPSNMCCCEPRKKKPAVSRSDISGFGSRISNSLSEGVSYWFSSAPRSTNEDELAESPSHPLLASSTTHPATTHERLLMQLLPFADVERFREWLRSDYVMGAWVELVRDYLGAHAGTDSEPEKKATVEKAERELRSDNRKYLIYHPNKEGWKPQDHYVRFIVTVVADNERKGHWELLYNQGISPAGVVYEILSFLRATYYPSFSQQYPPSYEDGDILG
ncbi:hypothetical protein MKZ38_006047 [Zalerion maritima]|uniref:Uncharacterized protein n=1 Tax=Zalerion maritima TaxID=339359 RepID=A0AAD5RJY7_9PEZI|nr:hypothetical protein MKZ38_006047 [Zalerion maritima]